VTEELRRVLVASILFAAVLGVAAFRSCWPG
jgi:hypothetical protein